MHVRSKIWKLTSQELGDVKLGMRASIRKRWADAGTLVSFQSPRDYYYQLLNLNGLEMF